MEAAQAAGQSGDITGVAKLAEKNQKETLKRLAPIVTAIYDQFVSPSSPGVDPETCRSMVKVCVCPRIEFCTCLSPLKGIRTNSEHPPLQPCMGEESKNRIRPGSSERCGRVALTGVYLQEFLIACKRHMPLLARQSMDAGMKFGQMMAGSEGAAMMKQLEDSMGEFQPQIAKTMQAVINELISRSDKMADDIFEAIDCEAADAIALSALRSSLVLAQCNHTLSLPFGQA